MSSFCKEINLSNELIDYVFKNFNDCEFNVTNYNLIITGTIGVGKSTVSQILSNVFERNNIKVCKYPEYIAYKYDGLEMGQKLFEMKMNGLISTFTFQNYILDIWETLLKDNKFNNPNNKINIFERIPYDAVYYFSKREFDNNNLTEWEYKTIIGRYEVIKQKYNLFEYSETKQIKIVNDNSVKTAVDIINIIKDDLNKGIKNRCVCLIITDDDKYRERLNIRDRTCEDSYTTKLLNDYKQLYESLF